MRRAFLLLALAFAIAWAACDGDEDSSLAPPDGEGPAVDLSAFTGCWHVTSEGNAYGSGPCRAALDSIIEHLTVASSESVFAAVDTVTHLTFVAPYRGAGDFTGTNISARTGSVQAVYRHAAGDCSLTTRISGDILALNGDRNFDAFYTITIQFASNQPCSLGTCLGAIAFQGMRRPGERCGGP